MGLVGWYGKRDDDEARATLLAAVDAGVDHFDTAASYQLGENETFVGRTLAPFRSRVVIATKCGLSRGADGSAKVDNTPATIRSSCDASLKRLGTDYIDLFYLHRIDQTVPIEESAGALADLVPAARHRTLTALRMHRLFPELADTHLARIGFVQRSDQRPRARYPVRHRCRHSQTPAQTPH
jgi:aryl-alcohol dehydrogenase-like predicted oxidoreductase